MMRRSWRLGDGNGFCVLHCIHTLFLPVSIRDTHPCRPAWHDLAWFGKTRPVPTFWVRRLYPELNALVLLVEVAHLRSVFHARNTYHPLSVLRKSMCYSLSAEMILELKMLCAFSSTVLPAMSVNGGQDWKRLNSARKCR